MYVARTSGGPCDLPMRTSVWDPSHVTYTSFPKTAMRCGAESFSARTTGPTTPASPGAPLSLTAVHTWAVQTNPAGQLLVGPHARPDASCGRPPSTSSVGLAHVFAAQTSPPRQSWLLPHAFRHLLSPPHVCG